MDPNNPVVKLCIEGMQAEAQSRFDDARRLFLLAWEARRDDFDACVAAHYLARHQETQKDSLRWNQAALEHAEAVGDERVRDFYPSLYLNLGWAHESLGDPDAARRCYDLAAARLDDLPAGPYRDMVAGGLDEGQKRVSPSDLKGLQDL